MGNEYRPPAYQPNAEEIEHAQQQQQQQQQQNPQATSSPTPQPHGPQSFPMQPMPPAQTHQQYHDPGKQQYQQQPQSPQQYNAPQYMYTMGPSPMPYQSLQTASMPVWCPQCHRVVNTVTNFEAGNFTHVAAVIFCCFTLCCCWIPYVYNGMQDVVHKCPTCPTTFAVFHRSGRTEVLVPPQPMPPQLQFQGVAPGPPTAAH